MKGKLRGGFFDLESDKNLLNTQRNVSDTSYQNDLKIGKADYNSEIASLQGDDSYSSLGEANYGSQFNTLKGGYKAGCATCMKKQNGGCLTCPKGQAKIIAVVRTFSIIIPKYYKKYKASSEDTPLLQNAAKPTKPAKPAKPTKPAKQAKRQAKHARKLRGGLLNASDWDGKYVWKANPNADGKLYSNDIHDLSGIQMNKQWQPSVFNIDTTLSGLTSVIV